MMASFPFYCVLIKSFLNWSANISACRPSNHVRRTTSVKTLAAFHLTGTCISPSEGGSCYSGTCVVVVVVAFVLCLSCCSATADTFLNRYLLDSPWLYDQSCHNCYTHDLKCSFWSPVWPQSRHSPDRQEWLPFNFYAQKQSLEAGSPSALYWTCKYHFEWWETAHEYTLHDVKYFRTPLSWQRKPSPLVQI